MTTAAKEHGEYTLFHMVNSLVREARRNEAIAEEYGDAERLLTSLTRQAPNRIYFSPDGKVCRVLFFSEEGFPFQVRIETLQFLPHPKIVKSEGLVAANPDGLEKEIVWWRRQFGMSGDLLSHPLLILESTVNPGELVHIGGRERQHGDLTVVTDLVFCRYYQSSIDGPRFIDLGTGADYKAQPEEEFKSLAEPPAFILRHLNPFSNSAIPTP